jgi:hypothetical protein
LIKKAGRCECCRKKTDGWWIPQDRGKYEIHHIAGGPYRKPTLCERSCCLVLCWKCHDKIDSVEQVEGTQDTFRVYPRARQLAMLKKSRPDHYCLETYNSIVRPMVAEEDVEEWDTPQTR